MMPPQAISAGRNCRRMKPQVYMTTSNRPPMPYVNPSGRIISTSNTPAAPVITVAHRIACAHRSKKSRKVSPNTVMAMMQNEMRTASVSPIWLGSIA